MNFKERLTQKSPVLFDGAMGTMLTKYGLKLGDLPEEFNFSHPHIIQQIHQEAHGDVSRANVLVLQAAICYLLLL